MKKTRQHKARQDTYNKNNDKMQNTSKRQDKNQKRKKKRGGGGGLSALYMSRQIDRSIFSMIYRHTDKTSQDQQHLRKQNISLRNSIRLQCRRQSWDGDKKGLGLRKQAGGQTGRGSLDVSDVGDIYIYICTSYLGRIGRGREWTVG